MFRTIHTRFDWLLEMRRKIIYKRSFIFLVKKTCFELFFKRRNILTRRNFGGSTNPPIQRDLADKKKSSIWREFILVEGQIMNLYWKS